MTAMLKTFGSPPGYVSRPSWRMRAASTPGSSAPGPKWRAMRSRSKRSMPAATGVWVVNTVPARTASSAASKPVPSSVSSRIRSRPRKPAWPSLVWNTSGEVAGERAVARTARTSYPEEHLLQEPVLAAPAVEPVGHVPLAGAVLLHVGVEQQQRHAADLGDPHMGVQGAAAGQGEGDPHGRGVGAAQQGDRQLVGVEQRVVLLLPAVAGQGLAEVAVPVEQADADERDAEVGGGLEVVAGEDAEAARVLRQGGGDAELRGEVGDGGRWFGAGLGGFLLVLVPAPAPQVVVEVVGGGAQAAQEAAVPGRVRRAGRPARSRAAARGRRRRRASPRGRRPGTGRGSRRARTSAGSAPARRGVAGVRAGRGGR